MFFFSLSRFYLFICLIGLCSFTLAVKTHANIDADLLDQLKTENILDTTSTLDRQEIAELQTQNEQLFEQAKIDFKILMIPSTDGESIEQYALDVFNTLEIGDEKLDNGLLLVVAKDDRQMRFEVGYGLEGDLTDAAMGRIIRNVLAPNFRNDDYYNGFKLTQNSIHSLADPSISSRLEASIPIHQPRQLFYILLALFWNVAVTLLIVILLAPIYKQILQKNLEIKGLFSFCTIFFPLNHIFTWLITDLNFYWLLLLYPVLFILLFVLNKWVDLYNLVSTLNKNIFNTYPKISALFFILSIIFISLTILDTFFLFLLLLSIAYIAIFIWVSNLTEQFKDLYPEKYQHWFRDPEELNSEHSSAHSGSSSFNSRTSSSSIRISSRSSGGRSGGGGASGSW